MQKKKFFLCLLEFISYIKARGNYLESFLIGWEVAPFLKGTRD
jgi:hypothetical protein